MPSRDEHLEQARHNTKFRATIDKVAFKDWTATVIFYTAIHYIDAVLATKGNIHPSNHPTRDQAVAASTELKPIYTHYAKLKNTSYNARYKPPTLFTTGQINELETEHLAKILAAVGQYVTI